MMSPAPVSARQPDTRAWARVGGPGRSEEDWLRLRPLGGADEDIIALIPDLELQPVEPATFPWPDPQRAGNHSAALLLRDALRLKLRAGAGPFRSFGNIAVEPRAYQLVPLLMALRLSTVRLLIATTSASARPSRVADRARTAGPWRDPAPGRALPSAPGGTVAANWKPLHLPAVALTAASANRVERDLPHGVTLFDHHPVVVVSLDYIKSERHREHFLAIAPECVLVDEAHTCASSGQGKQLRFELLQTRRRRRTPPDPADRHPALRRRGRVLQPALAARPGVCTLQHAPRRATHCASAWRGISCSAAARTSRNGRSNPRVPHFPRRMKAEITYGLTGEWGAFFDSVQAYCRRTGRIRRTNRHGCIPADLVRHARPAALCGLVARRRGEGAHDAAGGNPGRRAPPTCSADDRLHDYEADDLEGTTWSRRRSSRMPPACRA
jgi:hypothetical protein